jgi:hypothetical protein
MGLPADFQALLDYERMMEESVPNFGRILRTKDLSYRDMTNRRREERRNSRTRFDNTGSFRDDRRDNKGNRRDRERKRKDKSTEESRERKDRKSSRDYGKKERKSDVKKDDLPPQLPRDKWRKDEKGRTMKRKCRFCNKWHMDFDCPSKPASYNLTVVSTDQAHLSSDDESLSETDSSTISSSDSEDDRPKWKTAKDIPMAYHNVYSNAVKGKQEEEI